jgi:hypothetical protein
MIIKMTILRLLGSSDDKEKVGVARPEGPPLPMMSKLHSPVQWAQWRPSQQSAPIEPTTGKMKASVQWTQKLRLGFSTG